MSVRSAAVDLRNVFGDLAEVPRWVGWGPEKVPVDPNTGGLASSNDPGTWGTLADAERACEERGLSGVGFVLGTLDDGRRLGGVDLDACRDPDTGEITTWGRAALNVFKSYSEVSPSGTGVKILAWGAPDELPANVIPMDGPEIRGKRPQVEAYVGGRYFTITGRVLDDYPDEIRVAGDVGDAWDRLVRSLAKQTSTNGSAPPVEDRIPQGTRDRTLASLAGSMRRRGMEEPEILAALHAVNERRCVPPMEERDVERIARSISRYPPAENGMGPGHAAESGVAGGDAPTDSPVEPGLRDLSHDGLALELGDLWSTDGRYVDALGRWYFFGGSVWEVDEKLEHMTRTRQYLRRLADGVDDEKVAKRLRSAEMVARVVSLARSNLAQAADVEQWDADPYLLGTPGGTVELKTGDVREPRPEDYITKSTAVTPAPRGATPSLWLRHLQTVTGGNEALQGFLQRFLGYALTGSIREHAFAFAHGPGANGKSLTINTVMGILDDYALSIPTEMLMVSKSERHPTELARLRGVRLAVGNETEQGRRWAESKIKELTGGGSVSARFMRQDFFEFEPQFKLFIVGNHRPSLRGVDEAMRRRLHLVPFTVTIPVEDRDPDLPEKLEEEWPAILRWMIDGCLAWQQQGLNPPEAVREATDDYLSTEDAVSLWMDECGESDPEAWEPIAALYTSWKRWAEAAGEFVGTKKRLGRELEKRSCESKRGSGGVRGYRGYRLDPVEEARWTPE